MLKNLFRSEILDNRFLTAVELFNSKDFFAAYNLLFVLWRDTKSPNRKHFFQALVQCTAALHLLEKGKHCGARKVFNCALKKLMPYAALTKPFNIRKLIFDFIEYFDNLDPEFGAIDCDVCLLSKPKLEMRTSS